MELMSFRLMSWCLQRGRAWASSHIRARLPYRWWEGHSGDMQTSASKETGEVEGVSLWLSELVLGSGPFRRVNEA